MWGALLSNVKDPWEGLAKSEGRLLGSNAPQRIPARMPLMRCRDITGVVETNAMTLIPTDVVAATAVAVSTIL